MASPVHTSSSVEFFEEHGYFYDEDPAIGRLVVDLESRELSQSEEGLAIAKQVLLQNAGARPILEPYLRQPDVRLIWTGGPDPNHHFVFTLQPGEKDRIIVHMWSPESTTEISDRCHLEPPGVEPLGGAGASNGLIEVADAALKKRGYTPIPIQMMKGGLVISNRRSAFEIKNGSTISYDLRARKPQTVQVVSE